MDNLEFKEGCRFGFLVVTGKDNGLKGAYKRYECICDCGNVTWVQKSKLLSGHTRSCGCMSTRKSRFDLTTLIPYIDPDFPKDRILLESGKARMDIKIHCICKECRQPLPLRAIKHFFDYPEHFCMCRSCTQKKVSVGGIKFIKHNPDHKGLKRDYPRLYNIWRSMIRRCEVKHNNMYSLYGGRGISVCDEWHCLNKFIEWSLHNGYSEDLTIDRIDNTKGYSPDNCRWSSIETQNRNKLSTNYINGVDSKIFFESSHHHPSVTYIRFYMRYYKSGWSLERSLYTPNTGRKTWLSSGGDNLVFVNSIISFLDILNIPYVKNEPCLFIFSNKKIKIRLVSIYSAHNGNDDSYTEFINSLRDGYRLITIFEQDWNNKQDKIRRIIRDALCPAKRIFARSLYIKEINTVLSRDFLTRSHIDGYSPQGYISYGLFDSENTLLSVMSFGHLRGQNKDHKDDKKYELVRFASLSGIVVIGGASKLLTHFISDYKPKEIRTYSNNDFYLGNTYKKLGFSFLDFGQSIDYQWVTLDGKYIVSRYDAQKDKLAKMYPCLVKEALDNKKSVENYVMTELHYKKVYRCGNSRWYKKI